MMTTNNFLHFQVEDAKYDPPLIFIVSVHYIHNPLFTVNQEKRRDKEASVTSSHRVLLFIVFFLKVKFSVDSSRRLPR